VSFSKTIAAAYHAARAKARPGDRIVIFGSFVTVAAVMGLVQP
jgi:folylpolyglutamate synthase/dihydropteroate synthase